MQNLTNWEQLRSRLSPGQGVSLTSDSPLYPGPYTSEVLSLTDYGLRIAMPLDEGRLILIPVGSDLTLGFNSIAADTVGQVVDRRGGKDRYLEIRVAPEDKPEIEEELVTAPVVSVTSGKGGVGKSTFVINLAMAFAELGKRPCIIDADLGTANVDVLLNLSPPYNLGDVVNGSKHMVEVLTEGPKGVLVLPGGSGLRHLTRLHDAEFAELIKQFRALDDYADVIIIDTGSGVSASVTNFVAASSGAILVTTPEPHSITDAYALLKVLAEQDDRVPMQLMVNRAHNEVEGKLAADRMVYAAKRFLQYELEPIGYVREDQAVARAVRQQVDVVGAYPRSKAAVDIRRAAEHIAVSVGMEHDGIATRGGTGDFLRRIRSLLPTRSHDGVSGA